MPYSKNNKKFEKEQLKKEKIKKEKVNKIKFYEKQKRYNDCLLLIDDYIYEFPDDNYVKIYKCLILLKLKKSVEAEEQIIKILDSCSLKSHDRLFAYNIYGKILISLDKTEEAIEIYKKIIDESDDVEIVSRAELSVLYLKQGKEEDALKALEINGYNSKFLNIKRSQVYCKSKKYKKALEELDRPIINVYNYSSPECFDDYYFNQNENYLKGLIYYKIDKFDDALSYLYNALMPKNTLLYYKSYIIIAKIKLIYSKIDEAIEICNNLLNNNPVGSIQKGIYDVLSKAYIKKNDYETAKDRLSDCEFDIEKTNIALAKIEISKGNFEEAEKCLSFLNFDDYDVKNCYDGYYRLALIKFRLHKYDEFRKIEEEFLKCNDQKIINDMKYEFRRMRLIIDLEEGKEIEDSYFSYSEKQMISYSDELAINHIIDHHSLNYKISVFSENIDIISLYNYAKDVIKNMKPICDTSYDRYLIKYNNVGKSLDGGNINQLLIVTIPYTNNIITMYPYDGFESLLILNQENDSNDRPKMKRLSQIEKFNKKYKKETD